MMKSKTGGTKDWGIREIPKFPKGSKALVLPGAFYGGVVSLMASAGFQKADSIDDADVVVFIGGADIAPALYSEKATHTYGVNPERDSFEQAMYETAKEKGKICFGICRGAQFLHAMNGGKLWQDVNNHGRDHYIVDLDEDVRVLSSSIHHQMLQENEGMELVAVCEDQVATRFLDAETSVYMDGDDDPDILEIEAGAYPQTKCFFVQGHPEVGCQEYKAWTMTRLHDFFMDWTNRLPSIESVLKKETN